MTPIRVSWFSGSQVLAGALFLISAQMALSSLDASGKYLMGKDIALPLLALCLIRYSVHMVLAVALVIPAKGWRALRCKRPGAQILRGCSMLAATMSFFTTLHYLPLAQATSINFLAPLLVLAVAPWILKERTYLSRWLACSVGLLGVLIVIRPGAGLSTAGTLFGLLTACIMAVQYITSRRVAADDPYTTLIWSGAVGTLLLFLCLPLYWGLVQQAFAGLTTMQWLILLSTGFWGCLGHYLQIQAYRQAPASLLSPFLYLQIVSATALGWLVWGDIPDAVSWLGIVIVCLSGMTIGVVEWRRT